jgi:hypothetical protein
MMDVEEAGDEAVPGQPSETERCYLCGLPLSTASSGWFRVGSTGPAAHDPDGPMGEECWQELNRRLGVKDPGPRPRRQTQDETTHDQEARSGMATSKAEFARKYGFWIVACLVAWAILIVGLIRTFG